MSEVLETMDVDIDEINLDEIDLDDIDLTGFGEVNDSVEFPHIKFSSKLFKEFLKSAKKICSSGGKDIISKSTCLKFDAEKGKIVAYATDFDVYVSQELECLNTELVLTEPVVVPTDTFIKLAAAVPASTCIYKNGDTFYIRVFGGDLELETSTVAVDKFIFSDPVVHDSTVEVDDLKAVLKDFAPIVTAAVNPAEKRIVCESDGAYSNYMFAVLKDAAVTGNFDFKPKDIDVIKGLLSSSDDTSVEFLKTDDSAKVKRYQIKGSSFQYSFLVSESQFSEALKNNMESVVADGGVYVDFIQVYKIIELSSELNYALGKVVLNYEDGGISIDMLTKKGTSNKISIAGSMEGNTAPLAKGLTLQSKLLKILLRSFASKSSIRLSITDKGLGISADDYQACIYSEA